MTPSNGTAKAALSCCLAQRKLAFRYKGWALDAERDGNLVDYRRYRKESDNQWASAKLMLRWAREWKDRT